MSTADAFADFGQDEVVEGFVRNGRGEPQIVMPDGTIQTYSRASTFSNYLEDKSGIAKWEMAHAALGVAKSNLLIDKLRPLEYEGNSRLIAEYVAEAHVVARLHEKADYGTSMHAYLDPATDPLLVPWDSRMRTDLVAARALREAVGAHVLGTEVRVVNDEIKAAGTYDGLWEVPGLGVTTIDWKSGKRSLLSWTIQQAIYRDGVHYDVAVNQGSIAPDLARSDITPTPRSDIALIVHIPRGEGTAEIVPVNLNLGRELIQDALRIRKIRSAAWQKDLVVKWSPNPTPAEWISYASSRAELSKLIEEFKASNGLTEEVQELIRNRWRDVPAV